MILVFLYDEVRKYLMRKTSTVTINAETQQILRNAGWLERHTYYYIVCLQTGCHLHKTTKRIYNVGYFGPSSSTGNPTTFDKGINLKA